MSGNLYRSFWRWHFYGGLIVLPFLAWLAITGSLYLFKPEIEQAIYGNWITLSAPRAAHPAGHLVSGVEHQLNGEVTQIEVPASASESWRMRVEVGNEARTAFVDPASGAVLGSTQAGGIMKIIRDLHGLAITGTIGNALIEIAAGWAVVLVVTGMVLWWPRKGQPSVALRGSPRGRRFWRDFHASTGFLAGGIVLFLALTGMPWSIFWGANVQRIVAEQGLGRPNAPGAQPREAGKHHDGSARRATARAQHDSLPWTLQGAPPPHAMGGSDIGIDEAMRIAAGRGLAAPMTINLPIADGQPYSLSRKVVRAEDAKTIYIEPGSGRVLQDVSYAQFGKAAQIIEWGVATHQGQQYGAPNRWVMLLGCLALLLLCLSAPILWWKRRRAGRLELPPAPNRRGNVMPATVIVTILGAAFPLTGASILLVLLIDRLFFGGRRASRLRLASRHRQMMPA